MENLFAFLLSCQVSVFVTQRAAEGWSPSWHLGEIRKDAHLLVLLACWPLEPGASEVQVIGDASWGNPVVSLKMLLTCLCCWICCVPPPPQDFLYRFSLTPPHPPPGIVFIIIFNSHKKTHIYSVCIYIFIYMTLWVPVMICAFMKQKCFSLALSLSLSLFVCPSLSLSLFVCLSVCFPLSLSLSLLECHNRKIFQSMFDDSLHWD